jgi:hypothetical protein
VKILLQKECTSKNYECVINESDTSVVLSVVDSSSVLPFKLICYFNKKGKCMEEVYRSSCDSCSDILVNSWMKKNINWHKLDSTTWLSGMGRNLLLHIIDSKTFSLKHLKPKEYVVVRKRLKLKKRTNGAS